MVMKIKDKIINTAGRLFYENGYQRTGINLIIKEANIAKATLYHHFSSKTEICTAYLQVQHQQLIKMWDEELENSQTPTDKLISILNVVWHRYRQPNFYGDWNSKIFAECGAVEPQIAKLIKDQKIAILHQLEVIAQNNLMPISKAECEKMGGLIYLLYEATMSQSAIHQNDWPIYLAKNICIAQIEAFLKR